MKILEIALTIRTCLIKSIRIVSFSIIFVFGGCFSYSTITNEGEEVTLPDPGDDMKIECIDGRELEFEAYHYVAVNDSSGFVYGKGRILDENGNEGEKFNGKLTPVSIDSSHTVLRDVSFGGTKLRTYNCLTADGLRVRLNEGDFLKIPPGAAHGIWGNGEDVTKFEHHSFSGIVPFDSIKTVSEGRLSLLKTGGLAIPIVVGSCALLFLIVLSSGGFKVGG